MDHNAGYGTLICSVCSNTRGDHRSDPVSCRCPKDFDLGPYIYDRDDPFKPVVSRCFSSEEYEDQPVYDSGEIILIPVKKVKGT